MQCYENLGLLMTNPMFVLVGGMSHPMMVTTILIIKLYILGIS